MSFSFSMAAKESYLSSASLKLFFPFFILSIRSKLHKIHFSLNIDIASKDCLTSSVSLFKGLHISGNDAHFVLRALLMIAVRDVEQQTEGEEQTQRESSSLPPGFLG